MEVEEMKYLVLILLLSLPLVMGHAIKEGPQLRSVGPYNISLIIDPQFPVVGKEITFHFLTDAFAESAELHKGALQVPLDLEQTHDGYDVVFLAAEPGTYEMHVTVEGEEAGFSVTVDGLQWDDWLVIIMLLLFILVLIAMMYNDVR
jgi:hypothetical protein